MMLSSTPPTKHSTPHDFTPRAGVPKVTPHIIERIRDHLRLRPARIPLILIALSLSSGSLRLGGRSSKGSVLGLEGLDLGLECLEALLSEEAETVLPWHVTLCRTVFDPPAERAPRVSLLLLVILLTS